MERSPNLEDSEWANDREWQWVDDSIVLVALLIMQQSLFKSGYPAEVVVEVSERVNRLIRFYEKKGS